MGIVDTLYRAARTANTGSAIAACKLEGIARRAKNIAIGRGLARVGFWRRLWGGQ